MVALVREAAGVGQPTATGVSHSSPAGVKAATNSAAKAGHAIAQSPVLQRNQSPAQSVAQSPQSLGAPPPGQPDCTPPGASNPGNYPAAVATVPDLATPVDPGSGNQPAARDTISGRGQGVRGPSLVLDAEIVGVECGGDGRVVRLRAFQELATRARGAVAAHEVGVWLGLCGFVLSDAWYSRVLCDVSGRHTLSLCDL